MEESARRVWVVRLLPLLIMACGPTFLIMFTQMPHHAYPGRIEIRANENIGEIISAVEALGREDVHIKVRDVMVLGETQGFFKLGLGFFVIFGLNVLIYYGLRALVERVIMPRTRDMGLLEP